MATPATADGCGLGAKNCLIHSPDRLVVLLGIDNAVVVDTPDAFWSAISIAPRKCAISSTNSSARAWELHRQINRFYVNDFSPYTGLYHGTASGLIAYEPFVPSCHNYR